MLAIVKAKNSENFRAICRLILHFCAQYSGGVFLTSENPPAEDHSNKGYHPPPSKHVFFNAYIRRKRQGMNRIPRISCVPISKQKARFSPRFSHLSQFSNKETALHLPRRAEIRAASGFLHGSARRHPSSDRPATLTRHVARYPTCFPVPETLAPSSHLLESPGIPIRSLRE